LDFVLFFSSIESFATSHGKASYASGCAFTDVFGRQLARSWACKAKVMNWGYWGDLGAAAGMPAAAKKRLALSGVEAIDAASAMDALSVLLRGPFDQLAFLKSARPLSAELLGTSDVMDGIHRRSGSAPETPVPTGAESQPQAVGNAAQVLQEILS